MLFNTIGRTYNQTRVADERITYELIRLMDIKKGSIVADIGAGTGNYSTVIADAGYRIKAVEPSTTMLLHSRRNPGIEWIIGCAEDIPFQASSVDALFSVLALPHFSDIERAFNEMARVVKKGPIVLFTFDPMVGRNTWMDQYFPFCWDKFHHFPTKEDTLKILSRCTNRFSQIIPFYLPPDLKDHFAAAAWRNPHLYLNPDYRLNISSFCMTDDVVVCSSINRLSDDLENGRWEELYGEALTLDEMDAGYYFLIAK